MESQNRRAPARPWSSLVPLLLLLGSLSACGGGGGGGAGRGTSTPSRGRRFSAHLTRHLASGIWHLARSFDLPNGCEQLQVLDWNGDGVPDVIAKGELLLGRGGGSGWAAGTGRPALTAAVALPSRLRAWTGDTLRAASVAGTR